MNQVASHKQSVLFICVGNSARSQMAQALLIDKASSQFDVFSAGTAPEGIDPRTIAVLGKLDLPTQLLKSKPLATYYGKVFDYVITLCDQANQTCRSYEGAKTQLGWDFPDPKIRAGIDPFATTLNELSDRIAMFVQLASRQSANTKQKEQSSKIELNDNETIEPTLFFKCLTDELRLKALLLTHYFGELCVCELMEALNEDSQPKVSRNLAVLKKSGVISDRKHGQWVFYRVNPALPIWAKTVISQTLENNESLVAKHIERLAQMKNRPDKDSFCK